MAGLLSGVRVAVVCQGAPHPSEGASVVLFWWYLAALLDHGATVELFAIGEGIAATDPWCTALAARGPIRLHALAAPRPMRHDLRGLAVDAALAAGLSRAITRQEADLVLCFDWIAAAATADVAVPRAVWLGDLQFDTLLHHTRYALQEGSRRYDRLLLLGHRVRQIRRFYAATLRDAALVIVSSASSVGRLAPLGIASTYLAYPWPAPEPPPPRTPDPAAPCFLFSGTLGALGSRSGLHALLEQVLPRLAPAFAPAMAQVLLTGRGALPAWAAAALARQPQVAFLGFVEDLGALMATCTGFIAPIDVPVGNRSRILAAMAAGLPIVAHPHTALGNPLLRDRETCHLAADPADFAARMIELHRHPDAAAAIAGRARAAYLAHHAPAVAGRALVQALAPLAGRSA